MKKIIYSLSCMVAIALSGCFTSCQNEDINPSFNDGVEYIDATASGSIGTNTRTAFPVDNKGLHFNWSQGDQIVVISEDGTRNLGVMTLKNGAGEGYGDFEGKLSVRQSDKIVNIYYLGQKNTDTNSLKTASFSSIFNIAEQSSTHASLTDFGLMHDQVELTRDENGKASIKFEVVSLLTYARFNFHLPEGVSATNEEIIVSGANINNKFKLNYKDASITEVEEGPITIVPDWKTGDAFMVFVPAVNAVTEFTVAIGEKTYKATTDPITYLADYLFCAKNPTHGKDVYFSENGDWTLNYSAEGATNVPEAETFSGDFGLSHTFTVSDKVPVKEGYKFLGWSDTENGNVAYNGGSTITLTQPGVSKTIYAVWEEEWHFNTYTLYLGENGDYGQIDQNYPKAKTPWEFYYTENWDEPNLNGYTFLGWADSEDATTPDYTLSGKTLITTGGKDVQTKTVYPVWKKNVTSGNITAPGSTGTDY